MIGSVTGHFAESASYASPASRTWQRGAALKHQEVARLTRLSTARPADWLKELSSYHSLLTCHADLESALHTTRRL